MATFVFSIASPQAASQHAGSIQGNAREITCGDYTFKFLITGQMAQVIEGGRIVGTIIGRSGDLEALPAVTGTDAGKLGKTFEEWWAATKRLLAARGESRHGLLSARRNYG
jgi:hypothetical protein